jgi:peptide/nickel transport system permease protein
VNATNIARRISIAVLLAIFVAGLFASIITPYSYATQFREAPNSSPSAKHLLGTDALGRDLLVRLLYGTRVSLLLAPAAAFLSTLIAGIFGAFAGLYGGWPERLILAASDLSMALPLLFVLLALRAFLPLDLSPVLSVTATFLLLGMLGWSTSLRVVSAYARAFRNSDFLLMARATGCGPFRTVLKHVLPNLRPVLFAQFWISVPVFILAEATLSMLGLGVMEPLPSWGNLLRGLEDFSAVGANPWKLAPLVAVSLVVICFQIILPAQEDVA